METNISSLNSNQIQKRFARIDDLDEYIDRGEFPVNDKFQTNTPFIKDENNTLCAMAYLIQKSGNSQLVEDLDKEGRNFYIPQFTSLELKPWLEENGLFPWEASIIQPAYSFVEISDNPFKLLTMILQLGMISMLLAYHKIKPLPQLLLVENSFDKIKGLPQILGFSGIVATLMMLLFPFATYHNISGFPPMSTEMYFVSDSFYYVPIALGLVLTSFLYHFRITTKSSVSSLYTLGLLSMMLLMVPSIVFYFIGESVSIFNGFNPNDGTLTETESMDIGLGTIGFILNLTVLTVFLLANRGSTSSPQSSSTYPLHH